MRAFVSSIISALIAALICPGWGERVERIEVRPVRVEIRPGMTRPAPRFPSDPRLESRLKAIMRGGKIDAEGIQSLLERAVESGALVRIGKSIYRSAWHLLDELILSMDEGTRSKLAELHEMRARVRAGAALKRGDLRTIVELFRLYPLSRSVHEAMLMMGERLLRRGFSNSAYWLFRSVLSHSTDPAIADKAKVGLWLSLPGLGAGPDEIEKAFEGVPPGAELPWMGGVERADRIKSRLLSSVEPIPEPAAPSLSEIKLLKLRLPPVPPWDFDLIGQAKPETFPDVLGRLVEIGDKLILSGPELIALFEEGAERPLWVRKLGGPRIEDAGERVRRRGGWIHPGRFVPAADGERLYSRWGVDESGRMVSVAAFDLRTGRMIWSTADDPELEGLRFATDPVLSDGRLYLLAFEERNRTFTLYLVCLDAESGELIFKRLLGHRGWGGWINVPGMIDIASFGGGLAARYGMVCGSSEMGFLFCADAPDGLVRWAHVPPGTTEVLSFFPSRESPPVIAGDRIAFLPRDHQSLICLDAQGGGPIWEGKSAAYREIVGAVGGLVLVSDGRRLIALKLSSGETAWSLSFEEGIDGHPILRGRWVYLLSSGKLLRIDALVGRADEEAEVDIPKLCSFGLIGDELAFVTPDSFSEPEVGGPIEAPQLGPNIWRIWFLPRPSPRAWRIGDRLYLYSEGVLEPVEVRAQMTIPWKAVVPPGFDLVGSERSVLLVYGSRVVCLDPKAGSTRWVRDVPFAIGQRGLDEPYFVFKSLSGGRRYLGVINTSTGELRCYQFPPGHGLYVTLLGDELHIIGRDIARDMPGGHEVIRISDGQVLALLPFPPKGERWLFVAMGGKFIYYWSLDDDTVYEYSLEERKLTGREMKFREFAAVIERDEELLRKMKFFIEPWASAPERELPSYTLSYVGDPLDLQRQGNKLWILSREVGGSGELRLDLFDLDEKKHIKTWLLQLYGVRPAVDSRALKQLSRSGSVKRSYINRLAVSSEVIFVTGRNGLHAFASVERLEGLRTYQVYLGDPAAVDGRLEEWDEAEAVPLEGEVEGRLYLRHDGSNLYLAAAYRDPHPLPLIGRIPWCGGDWLEVGLMIWPPHRPRSRAWRFGVGIGPRGEVEWRTMEGKPFSGERSAAVRYDPSSGELIYELKIPVEFMGDRLIDRIGLSIRVWDERLGRGPEPILRWGKGFERGRFDPDRVVLILRERRPE